MVRAWRWTRRRVAPPVLGLLFVWRSRPSRAGLTYAAPLALDFFAARGRSYRAMRVKEQLERGPSSQNALLWMTAKGGFLRRIRHR